MSHHSPPVTPAQNLLERPSEIVVEYGIDDGVQGTVAVTEPEEELKECDGNTAGLAQGRQRVGEEEGKPADDEHPDDHGQHEGEALLAVLPTLPAAPFDALPSLQLGEVVSRLDLAYLGLAFGFFFLHGAGVAHLVVRGGRLLHVHTVDLAFVLPHHHHLLLGLWLPIQPLMVWFMAFATTNTTRWAHDAILLLVGLLLLAIPWGGPGPLFGNLVDADVDQDHDDAGQEEGADAGGDDVPPLLVDLAHGPLFVGVLLLHGDQGWEGDDGGDDPHDEDDAFDPAGRALEVVFDGLGDGPVAVQADGTQVSYGRCAEENIQGQVDLTPHLAKVPVAH